MNLELVCNIDWDCIQNSFRSKGFISISKQTYYCIYENTVLQVNEITTGY